MDDAQFTDGVRDVLRDHARLPVDPSTVLDHDNLYDSGMTSHATIHVMLALEERFDVEFPDALLTRNAFATIASIAAGVRRLRTAESGG